MKKTIILSGLELRNFKGVKSFSLVTKGGNARVYGDNATGKTTLFDAFTWLLFDKDSLNKKDFSLKTIDRSGEDLHKLEHEVSAALCINGNSMALKKVFKEKWTKKRGSVQQEFSGHTTDYFVNDVPVKKKEYTDKIAEFINEDVFKLLTNPAYFNEQLKWQDRRRVLLEIAGDVTDMEVIASNPTLEELKDILSDYNSDEIKKMIAAKRKKINDELEKIPVRIDEIHRNLLETNGLDKQSLEQEISSINGQIDEKQDIIASLRNGNAIGQKQKEIQEIEMELLKIKQAHEAGTNDGIYRVKAAIQEEESNVRILNRDLQILNGDIGTYEKSIQNSEKNLCDLRQEWQETNELQFTHNVECECPTCGQELPLEQIEEAKEKALANFNYDKSKQLDAITIKGKKMGEYKEEIIKEKEKAEKKVADLSSEISKKEAAIEKLKAQLSELESNVTDITENKEYVAKLEEKQSLTKELNDIKLSAEGSIQEVQMEVLDLKNKRNAAQKELAKFAVAEQSLSRIAELEEEEKRLSAEFEELEQQLYLTEEFIRTKVNMLEEKINSKFKYARFNLFKNNINGGLEEICETTYQGVPYSSGLNNAARINVGLDIINTLSEHYGFNAPIFVDNAEAVTHLIEVDTQVISLVVSEKDKQLRVETEVEETTMEEAI